MNCFVNYTQHRVKLRFSVFFLLGRGCTLRYARVQGPDRWRGYNPLLTEGAVYAVAEYNIPDEVVTYNRVLDGQDLPIITLRIDNPVILSSIQPAKELRGKTVVSKIQYSRGFEWFGWHQNLPRTFRTIAEPARISLEMAAFLPPRNGGFGKFSKMTPVTSQAGCGLASDVNLGSNPRFYWIAPPAPCQIRGRAMQRSPYRCPAYYRIFLVFQWAWLARERERKICLRRLIIIM